MNPMNYSHSQLYNAYDGIWFCSTGSHYGKDFQFIQCITKNQLFYSDSVPLLWILVFSILFFCVCSSLVSASGQKGGGRLPPTAPYNLPGLGHAFSFAWDMPGFLAYIR